MMGATKRNIVAKVAGGSASHDLVFDPHLRHHRISCSFCVRQWQAWLAEDGGIVHTPSMTLRNAALLALIGTILTTALLAFDLILNVLNVLRGLVPAVALFSSLIYAFGAFSVAVFFFVFYKAQR